MTLEEIAAVLAYAEGLHRFAHLHPDQRRAYARVWSRERWADHAEEARTYAHTGRPWGALTKMAE